MSPGSAVIVSPLDGAINRLPDGHSPAGNRDSAAVVNVTAAWDDASDDDVNVAWTRAAFDELSRFSTGGSYINFMTEEEGDDRIRAA